MAGYTSRGWFLVHPVALHNMKPVAHYFVLNGIARSLCSDLIQTFVRKREAGDAGNVEQCEACRQKIREEVGIRSPDINGS